MDSTEQNRYIAWFVFGAILITLFLVWSDIFSGGPAVGLYFLNVGQGDSELAVLPGGATILTDAGPDRKVLDALRRIAPSVEHIDVAVISHPQMDHFNGFNFLLDKYTFGAFVVNGRKGGSEVKEWESLMTSIRAKNIPILTLGAGDSIKYSGSRISFLSPDASFLGSGELNDTGLVEHVHTPQWSALLLADVGSAVENYLAETALPADILKIAHHGSKYSTTAALLSKVKPRIAIIEVGARNSYGHPAAATLELLRNSGIPVLRTDNNGTIRLFSSRDKLLVERKGPLP